MKTILRGGWGLFLRNSFGAPTPKQNKPYCQGSVGVSSTQALTGTYEKRFYFQVRLIFHILG